MRKRKMGTYEHFCVLIFAQGTWNDKDREDIRKPIQNRHNKVSDNPYHFFLKLTYRDEMPLYADCQICRPIYEMFEELKGNNDGILYHGHHYLILEEDIDDMKELTNLILSNDRVKKIYMLYVDSFREIKTTVINSMNLQDLKEKLTLKKCVRSEFIKILDDHEFKSRTIYEISKGRY